MAEAALPTARRDEDNTFTGKTRFNQNVRIDAPTATKGVSVTTATGSTANQLEIQVGGVVAVSLSADASNIVETLALRPGLNAQGVFDVSAGRYKAGFDGGNAYVDSLNKEVQIRANAVPNIRVGQSATLGFYNTTPVAKPILNYSRATETAAATQLRTALAALGLVTDSTTA